MPYGIDRHRPIIQFLRRPFSQYDRVCIIYSHYLIIPINVRLLLFWMLDTTQRLNLSVTVLIAVLIGDTPVDEILWWN